MEYVILICPTETCGIPCKVPTHIYEQAKQNPDRWIWCPNEHRFHYAESEADRLRKRIEEHQQTINNLRAALDQERADNMKLTKRVSYWTGIAHRKPKRG